MAGSGEVHERGLGSGLQRLVVGGPGEPPEPALQASKSVGLVLPGAPRLPQICDSVGELATVGTVGDGDAGPSAPPSRPATGGGRILLRLRVQWNNKTNRTVSCSPPFLA